jgi:hypothetical protein
MSGRMDEQMGLAYNEVVNSLGTWTVEGEGGRRRFPRHKIGFATIKIMNELLMLDSLETMW